MVKNLPAKARDAASIPGSGNSQIPWSRKWQPTPVFLLEKFHRYSSLEGHKGAWTVHGATKSWIGLSDSAHSTSHTVYNIAHMKHSYIM